MRQTARAVAMIRQSAPLFVQLTQQEIKRLRPFPCWIRQLYMELVALSNFQTGCIYNGSDPRVSYAKLHSLLDHDHSPQGGRDHPSPSIPQIRRALDQLVAVGLVVRDSEANVGARMLFLAVEARKSAVLSSVNIGRGSGRSSGSAQRVKKPNKNKELEAPTVEQSAEASPEVPAVVSEGDCQLPKKVSVAPQLPTGEQAQGPFVAAPEGPVAVLVGGSTAARPLDHAAEVARLPPERQAKRRPLTAAQREMFARMRSAVGVSSGAPRGAEPCPLEAGTPPSAGLPPSALIRRPTNAV